MNGIHWSKCDGSRFSGRKASKQVSSKSMVVSCRKAAPHPKRCGPKGCGGDTQVAQLGRACRLEATGGQHNSEIQHVGKGRAVQCFKHECKAAPAERSQERVARAEVTGKEAKLCHSTFPRLEGAVPELQRSRRWDWDGPGMSLQLLSMDLRVAEVTPVPLGVCFPIAFPES